MKHLNKTITAHALKHAHADFPREACGLIVLNGRRKVYVPCENKATQPGEQFVLSAEDFARAEEMGEVIAVVHSHPNAHPDPSPADVQACNASGLPWYIVAVPGNEWATLLPRDTRAEPLWGREFVHGTTDCYGFIRDWYAQELGIDLADGSREDEWWKKGQNLYLERYAQWGFQLVTDGTLRRGDVLLMQVLSNVPNHGAVYLGDDLIGHHLYGRPSCREVYGGYWRKHTTHVLRFAQ